MASTGHSVAVFPDPLLFQDCILLWLLYSLNLRYFCLPRNFHHQWDFLEVLCWKTKCWFDLVKCCQTILAVLTSLLWHHPSFPLRGICKDWAAPSFQFTGNHLLPIFRRKPHSFSVSGTTAESVVRQKPQPLSNHLLECQGWSSQQARAQGRAEEEEEEASCRSVPNLRTCSPRDPEGRARLGWPKEMRRFCC